VIFGPNLLRVTSCLGIEFSKDLDSLLTSCYTLAKSFFPNAYYRTTIAFGYVSTVFFVTSLGFPLQF
jgi:hypothetical protein